MWTLSRILPGSSEFLSYLLELDNSGRFGDIAIASMTRIEGDVIEFTLLGSLQRASDRLSSLEVALNSLPTTVSLTSISATSGTLNIEGTSPNEDDVLLYLQSLEASSKFDEVSIDMTRIEDGGMRFSLVLKTGV